MGIGVEGYSGTFSGTTVCAAAAPDAQTIRPARRRPRMPVTMRLLGQGRKFVLRSSALAGLGVVAAAGGAEDCLADQVHEVDRPLRVSDLFAGLQHPIAAAGLDREIIAAEQALGGDL